MIAPFDLEGNPSATDRRNCGRQRVLFSSVVLREGNCGRVLNISPHGLALQTDTQLAEEELPNFRFKFSPSLAWVEAKGRVAWRNNSKNVVGIEFISLTDEVQKQIKTWMDWKRELSEPLKGNMPVADAKLNGQSGTKAPIETTENVTNAEFGEEVPPGIPAPAVDVVNLSAEDQRPPKIATAEFVFPPLEPATLNTENQSQPTNITVRDQIETKDLRRAADEDGGVKVAYRMGDRLKLVVLALLVILLLSAPFFRPNHLQKSSNSPQTREVVRAPRPPAPPAQATLPAGNLPATSSHTISSGVTAPLPSVPSSGLKPTVRGPAFVLQVAAMLHEENANALAASLREMNLPVFVLKLPTERFHHVLVGPYSSANAAIETQNELEKRGYKPIRTEWKVSSR